MLQSDLIPVLALIASLQTKHFMCDGPLQTHAMVISKSIYGQGLGVLHSAIHGLGTLLVMFAFQYSPTTAFGLALADVLIHYHVDFTKENIVKGFGWTTHNAKFWWALSADQALHQLTYLGLTYVAITTVLNH
jgi:hypothetical protein